MSEGDGTDDRWDGIAALADPVRRRLYDYVGDRDTSVARDEAAEAVGLSRTLAAYHLDRLAEAGLLTTSYARTGGRSGPGAGRPAKHYQRADREIAISVPPRTYGLLAALLADATAADRTGRVWDALMAAADAEGRRDARRGELLASLRARGYEPVEVAGGDVILRNCPFHQVAQEHTALVCGLNEALVRGCLVGCEQDADRAELAPGPGRCCVVIHPAAA